MLFKMSFERVDTFSEIRFGGDAAVVVLDFELVGGLFQLELNGIGDPVKRTGHRTLQDVHQPPSESVCPHHKPTLPSASTEHVTVLPKVGLLPPRYCFSNIVLPPPQQCHPRLANELPHIRMERIPISLQDTSTLLWINQVHLCNDSNGTQPEGASLPSPRSSALRPSSPRFWK